MESDSPGLGWQAELLALNVLQCPFQSFVTDFGYTRYKKNYYRQALYKSEFVWTEFKSDPLFYSVSMFITRDMVSSL